MSYAAKTLFIGLFATLLLTELVRSETVWVTGNPAGPDFLKEILQERGWSEFPPAPLKPGQSWSDPSGNTVQNLDWKLPPAILAALSDHPEKVEQPGGLFSGGLTSGRTLNFQYYHLGLLEGESPRLTLYVYNPGNREAKVYLRKGIGKPSLDYFSSGHTNNVRWFEAESAELGSVWVIPAKESRSLFTQPLPFNHVVSGLLGLCQMEGPPLQFAFVARASEQQAVALDNLLKEGDVHSRGFYPVPLQKLTRRYEVGNEPLHIAIGNVRQQTFSGVRELRGDYGVVYETVLYLKNPSARPNTIQLLFNPRGGNATGTFLIDREVVEVPNTPAFKESLITSLKLLPGEQKQVKITTVPEGASSYPVRIIVKGE